MVDYFKQIRIQIHKKMKFKYFENPESFSVISDENVCCDLCNKEKICFEADLFYGEDEIDFICPECLQSGALKNKDIITCEGDISELKRQIKNKNQHLSDQEIHELAVIKTSELETTTPKLITWQDWFWPCSVGDYCTFIGYGSKEFYQSLSNSESVKQFFSDSIYFSQKEESDCNYLWDEVLPEKPIKNYHQSEDYGTLFYVFKCLHSDKIVTVWDCD
jgi:uncharacterized protein CbrC (UPF0167 family)